MNLEVFLPVKDATVECGSCRLCCKRTRVPLVEGHDDPRAYVTEVSSDGLVVLPHKDNGDCHYLSESGCSIHGRAPVVCRRFSCVAHYKGLTSSQQRKAVRSGLTSKEVLREGRRRARR